MTTLKQIADTAGVSRGTVDRVLNNRGSVKPETAAQVRRALEAADYRPNKAGRALAAIRKPVRLGVLLSSEGNPFFDDVLRGVQHKAEALRDFGVEVLVKTARGYDVERQLSLMAELRESGINGLAIAPINDPRVCAAIDGAVAAGVRVVSLNQDIWGSRRACYIGSDYVRSGEIAAGLFRLICREENKQIGVITGSRKMMGHNQRIFGFEKIIRTRYANFDLCAVVENDDDDARSYEVTRDLIASHPHISGFYFAAAGVEGGVRAILEFCPRPYTIISCDTTSGIAELVRRGVISATVGQQPYEQGRLAVGTLYDMLVNNIEPASDCICVDNEIFIAESL